MSSRVTNFEIMELWLAKQRTKDYTKMAVAQKKAYLLKRTVCVVEDMLVPAQTISSGSW